MLTVEEADLADLALALKTVLAQKAVLRLGAALPAGFDLV